MTEPQNPAAVVPLDAPGLTVANAGGKAANLSQLAQAGLPVPNGFVLTTNAYQAFVRANGLEAKIDAALQSVDRVDPAGAKAASDQIRQAFHLGPIPEPLVEQVRAAYRGLGQPAVAVRSSATAEDLPSASFAGQQDTYLNVMGLDDLFDALVDCWGSLWTARAIGYRYRQGVGTRDLALAVIVQRMVQSDVSGVLFTANPLTGKRDQSVVDATFGLGEALVSGQVEPDHYVLDRSGRIVEQKLGSKAVTIRGDAGGGTVSEEADRSHQASLDTGQLAALVEMGKVVAEHFGSPQDVEWAWAGGELVVLQSRPITTLFPVPVGLPADSLRAFFSFAAVQGLLDPMTPLGRDVIKMAFAGAGELFGAKTSLEGQRVLAEAGERLWVDTTGLIRNRIGRRVLLAAMDYIEPATCQLLGTLIDEGEFGRAGRPSLRGLVALMRPIPMILPLAVLTAIRPDQQAERFQVEAEAWLKKVKADVEAAGDLAEWVPAARRSVRRMFVELLPAFVPRFGVGMGSYNMLIKLSHLVDDAELEPRSMMRGLPHNVTTEMDLKLWAAARQIRLDPEGCRAFAEFSSSTLAARYLERDLPAGVIRAVDGFMERYGMRGLGEIDFGRSRWQEAPEPVFDALASYLGIEDASKSPDAVYRRGQEEAINKVARLRARLRKQRLGAVKAWLAGGSARRMRALLGLRESPKFAIIRMFWLIRNALLILADPLVVDGTLARREDVFFLRMRELEAIGRGEELDGIGRVGERRAQFERESNRKQIPRLLLSDGRAFYRGVIGADSGDAALYGDPVSPGVAEGNVRVVFDPSEARMASGDILVCPGTDPSWTPLFLAANALVMEVGGMMTHGAVVAREYGIPAVVGVHDATGRLKTGQRIRVDGSTGHITVLSEAIQSAQDADPAPSA